MGIKSLIAFLSGSVLAGNQSLELESGTEAQYFDMGSWGSQLVG